MSEFQPKSLVEQIDRYTIVSCPLDNKDFLKGVFQTGKGLCFVFNLDNLEIKIWDAFGKGAARDDRSDESRYHVNLIDVNSYKTLAGYVYIDDHLEITMRGHDVPYVTPKIDEAIRMKVLNFLK